MGAFGNREGAAVALPDDAAIQDRLASLAARDAAIQDRIASLAARVAHLEAAKTPMGVAPPPGGGDSGNAKLRGVDIPELHEQPNVLDGCSHVYLDVGSNVGVQIRKLYDGRSVYPDAPVHDIFDKYFGKDHSKVCAIGFEPNPHHTKRLKAIQGCYQALGFRMSFVFAAASSTDGQATFNIDGVGWANEWSSSLVATDKISKNKGFFKHTVPTIDLAKFINNVVARRKIPAGVPPAVVMKLDIEGSEVTLLPHMMQTGVLCAERSQSVQPFPLGVNISFIEFHPMSFPAKSKEAHALYMLQNDLNEIVGLDTDNCKPTNITALDDETFLHDGKPFPDGCSQFK